MKRKRALLAIAMLGILLAAMTTNIVVLLNWSGKSKESIRITIVEKQFEERPLAANEFGLFFHRTHMTGPIILAYGEGNRRYWKTVAYVAPPLARWCVVTINEDGFGQHCLLV